MAITKNKGHQEVISAYVDIAFGDVGTTATAYNAIDLPVGSEVIGGALVVDTAWDTGTTATLSVGDASSAARYLAATSVKATGRTALVPTGFVTTATQPAVSVTTVITGTATTVGAARLRVDYIVRKRATVPRG